MQPPTSRPDTSRLPPPRSSQAPVPTCFHVVASGSSSKRHQSVTTPESRWTNGPGPLTRSSQCSRPVGDGVRRVREVVAVDGGPPEAGGDRQQHGGQVREADQPRRLRRGEGVPVEEVDQVDRGLAAPRRDDARDVGVGEHPGELGGALRGGRRGGEAGAVHALPHHDVVPALAQPRRRRSRSARPRAPATPADGDVTPMRSPGRSGRGKRSGMSIPGVCHPVSMGFGDVLGQAIHSSSAVPRLYVAARKAGLGTSEAFEVLRISRDAMTSAAQHGRGVPGRANAMRHFTVAGRPDRALRGRRGPHDRGRAGGRHPEPQGLARRRAQQRGRPGLRRRARRRPPAAHPRRGDGEPGAGGAGEVGVRRAGLGAAALSGADPRSALRQAVVDGASSRRTVSCSIARWVGTVNDSSVASRPTNPSRTISTHAVSSRGWDVDADLPDRLGAGDPRLEPVLEHPGVPCQRGLDRRLAHHGPHRADEPGDARIGDLVERSCAT